MRSWWNSLTSSNRHADTKKNPYNPSFTSIRTGLTNDSVVSLNKNTAYNAYDVSSPSSSQVNLNSGYSTQFPNHLRRDTGTQGMALQDYQDGVAPPPPVADSWRRIDQWTEDNYPELFDQLSYGATEADIDELEHTLEMTLPGDLRESLYIHDGQERGGRPTGLFFGIALLDCEELVDEYDLWRKVAASLPRPNEYPHQASSIGLTNGGASSKRVPSGATQPAPRRNRQLPVKQGSKPDGAIQSVYAHPGWVPLAKDYMGNNIAVDLAPGSKGRVGQVILFGRDCDVKYVVATSWASFLANFVSDLESEHVIVDEDVGVGGEMGQLRYVVDLEHPEQQYSYLETLKARVRRRDRAIRGIQSESGSTTSLPGAGPAKRNGKGRAPSPLKNERQPRTGLNNEKGGLHKDTTTGQMPNGGLVIDTKEKAVAEARASISLTAETEAPIIATVEAEEAAKAAAEPATIVLEDVSLGESPRSAKTSRPTSPPAILHPETSVETSA